MATVVASDEGAREHGIEGRRRWLGLLAATLALPAACRWDRGRSPGRPAGGLGQPGRGGRADGAPPRWWTAFEDAELDALAERALAGNLTLAQAAQRLKAARALSRSSAAQALPQIGLHGAAQRQHRLSGPHGANELSGAEAGQGELPLAQEERSIGYYQAGFDARWELDLFGRIAAATDAARASGAAEADLRAARVSVAAGPCAPTSNCAARSGAIRCCPACWTTSAICSPWCRSADARHRQRFRCGPRQRAGSRNGRPVAAVGATGAAARAASGGAYRRARSRPGCWRPPASPAARRADRAAAGRYRARPAGHPSRGTAGAAGRGRTAGVDRRAIPAPDPVR